MTTETLTLVRLTPAVYKDLESKTRKLIVNSTTTPLEAGYALGVQDVLRLIREGLVMENTHVPTSN